LKVESRIVHGVVMDSYWFTHTLSLSLVCSDCL
jgi:hypothetical protein